MAPDPKPKDRRPLQPSAVRRAELAEAALRCLRGGGYATLTARKVAEEAGVSLGYISYHFRDMNELLAEAYRLASERLKEVTLSELGTSPEDPLDRLRAFLRAGFTPEFLQPDNIRVRIDLWSVALWRPEIAGTELELYERYREQLVRLLSNLYPQGRPDPERLAFVSDAIMATLDGLWLDWMRRRDAAAIRNGLDACALLAETVLVGRK